MDLNICTLVISRYHILVLILYIHTGYFHGHDMEGGGDDQDNGSNASSLSDNNKEAAVDILKDKGEDFVTGLMLICQDNAATMMDAPLPLLGRCPLPL
jgi:hypothetical protein